MRVLKHLAWKTAKNAGSTRPLPHIGGETYNLNTGYYRRHTGIQNSLAFKHLLQATIEATKDTMSKDEREKIAKKERSRLVMEC